MGAIIPLRRRPVMTELTTGMRVAFSRHFLRNIGQVVEGEEEFIMRGRVLAIEPTWPNCPVVLAAIQWGNGQLSCVNIRYLVREDRIHLESV